MPQHGKAVAQQQGAVFGGRQAVVGKGDAVHDADRFAVVGAAGKKEQAAGLGLVESGASLSVNFLPNAVYRPERCIRTTLQAAREHLFPIEQIMFEFTEVEQVQDNRHIRGIVDHYQALGFKTAIDDFGAGYSGLSLLADFRPDIIKLDMHLLRGIDQDPIRQAIVRHCLALFTELQITPLAEGVETRDEMACLREMGVSLMQGYLFARPGFETLPEVDFASL